MGFFGSYTFSGGVWSEGAPGKKDVYLFIDIHDSDFASVRFSPTIGPPTGCFYLGIHPRDYFDDVSAGLTVDVEQEASRFAGWAEKVLGLRPDPLSIASLMAREGEVDDESTFTFVEEAVHALLEMVGIPDPPDLPTD